MRNLYVLIIGGLFCLLLGNFKISASDFADIYTNTNGVQVTIKEYNFIKDFYGEDFFDTMTYEDYNWIQDLNINNSNVNISQYGSSITTYATSHTTPSKKLSIAKSCSTVCTVIINNQWLNSPTIRSYDLIGARFVNTSLANSNVITKVVSSGGTEYSNNIKVYSDGLGTSVDLPNVATDLRVEQKFYTIPGGTIFGSYQHAMQNITLATSQSFVIDYTGAGGVFSFYGNAIGKFDQMAGVII